MDYHFYLDGVCSKDFGIQLQETIVFSKPSRKFQTVSITGRNGDLHISEDAFESVQAVARCFIIGKHNADKVARAVQWLTGKRGIRRLELPYEPDIYRNVTIYEGFDCENRINLLGVFDVPLSAGPECWLKSGEDKITAAKNMKLYNPYMPAKPLLEVSGSGSGTVSVGGVTVSILDQTETLFVDCYTENAYNINIIPQNAKIHTPQGFPALREGENTVSWSGGVTGVKIVPRWWRL